MSDELKNVITAGILGIVGVVIGHSLQAITGSLGEWTSKRKMYGDVNFLAIQFIVSLGIYKEEDVLNYIFPNSEISPELVRSLKKLIPEVEKYDNSLAITLYQIEEKMDKANMTIKLIAEEYNQKDISFPVAEIFNCVGSVRRNADYVLRKTYSKISISNKKVLYWYIPDFEYKKFKIPRRKKLSVFP